MTDPNAKYNLNEALTFIPTCEEMCPPFERHEREFTNGLNEFEKISKDSNEADHSRVVKRFHRSAAGDDPQFPCDVRTPIALKVTHT
jgi:SAC3/GANP family